MVVDCPETKSKPSTSKKLYKKKDLRAWDSESEIDEEVDMTHVCFISNDDTCVSWLMITHLR